MNNTAIGAQPLNTETARKVDLVREVIGNGSEVFVLDLDADKANYSRISALQAENIATTKTEHDALLAKLDAEFESRATLLAKFEATQLAKLPRAERPCSITAVIHPMGGSELSDAGRSVIQKLMKKGRSHGIQIILSVPLNVFESLQAG